MLYSDYGAGADFTIETKEKFTEGSFELLRADNTRIDFKLPKEYASISIYGDSGGNSDVFSFEMSGIPASVPKSIASDLSLMFSLFSDAVPSKLQALEESSFTLYENQDKAKVSFTENGTSYNIVYSTVTGIPISFGAINQNTSVNITIKNFDI